MSGGYGGSKRMLWLHGQIRQRRGAAEGASGSASRRSCRAKMVLGTGTGDAGRHPPMRAPDGHNARSSSWTRFGAPMPPRAFGDRVVSVLEDPQYAEGVVFGLNGDAGVTVMESAAP